MSRPTWHFLTCEYPPQLGGVSDYVAHLARALTDRGHPVEVWAPALDDATRREEDSTARFPIHRLFGRFRIRDLRRVGRQLDARPGPRRLLVQWVPHGFGWRAMNLPFCLWLWSRARLRGDEIQLMVHEPFLSFREGSLRQDAVAVVHRLMSLVLLRTPSRVWVSIPAWEKLLRPWGLGRRVPWDWLPLPSTIPVLDRADETTALRQRLLGSAGGSGGLLIGHFGTFGRVIAGPLSIAIPALARRRPQDRFLLLGKGGDAFAAGLERDVPELRGRLIAPGRLDAEPLSIHLRACDLLLQPYPDGASSRRTSLMAGLAHGRPIVTTAGRFSEACWGEREAVALVPANDPEALVERAADLLADAPARDRLAQAAAALYDELFTLERVAERLGSVDAAS